MSAADVAIPVRIDALYLQHHGWLKGWLARKLGCSQQAADLAQDTFVRVIASRRTTIEAEPRALLVHIAKGLVIDLWRRQDVERAWLDAVRHLAMPVAPSAEERYLVIEALMQVEAMLAGLPARSRACFLMAQVDGLTLQQIAERTGMPAITVRRHIRKALLACMAVR